MKKECNRAYFEAHYLNIPIIEHFEKEHEKTSFDPFKKSEKVADGRQSINHYELVTWNNKNKQSNVN